MIRCIGDIKEKCGPLLGPNMLKLVDVMRAQHGYSEFLPPSEFAQRVAVVLGEQAPTVDQCPEKFAAEALLAMGIDATDVDAESSAFQRRDAFHFGH